MELDFNELRELLAVLNQTDIAELTLKSDDFELVVRKGGGDRPLATASAVVAEGVTAVPPPAAVGPPPAADVATPAPAPSAAPLASEPKSVDIVSPMVGTFYRAPGPDEPPYVDVGDRIRTGQTVCIIEAMKLMNELEAEVTGEILEVLVQNGEPVEYGQALMRVKPD